MHTIAPTVIWNHPQHAYSKVVGQSAHGTASLHVGTSPASVASLMSSAAGGLGYFKMLWWVSLHEASYHQLSKSAVVLRLLWSDGVEKRVSVWGEILG